MKQKYLSILIVCLVVFVLIAGYIFKGKLNSFIGESLSKTGSKDELEFATKMIQEHYNYIDNKLDYQYTLLEFSSSGCSMCKQMEPVLEEIRNAKEKKINVVFLHIMKPENLPLMKFYGISATPMQILLDKYGKEVFRHYGVISSNEIYQRLGI